MYQLFQIKFKALKKEERISVLLDLLKTGGSCFVLLTPDKEPLSE